MTYWTEEDFHVFEVEGLQPRMTALQTIVQPKFRELGEHFSLYFSSLGKGEFFPHVAKHARRTVNPPNDSWVAFAPSKRGYKALPHFQIGLWNDRLFLTLCVIYENKDKKGIAERLEQSRVLQQLPGEFVLYGDHTKKEASTIEELENEGIEHLLTRLQDVKSAELVVGCMLTKDQAVQYDEQSFIAMAEETFHILWPVYEEMTR